MTDKRRTIEIFSADCPVCRSAVELVKLEACSSCDVQVLDMTASDVQKRAADLGITSVPAVVIDGSLADCCAGQGVDLSVLRAAGLGQPIA